MSPKSFSYSSIIGFIFFSDNGAEADQPSAGLAEWVYPSVLKRRKAVSQIRY